MRIVVPIKQVPETKNVKMDEATGTVVREGIESIVNPLDLYSIELALLLKKKYGGEVVAVTMGPPKASDALKEAISMGCDSAVLVSDRVFGGSDTWATSLVLAEAIKKIEYDIIICGERATDGDTGQVGPGIAAFLDLPVITYVSKVDKIDGQVCKVERIVEDGYEVLSCSLPLVLTVVKEVSEPGLPTLRGKQRAKKAEIPSWGHEILGIEPGDVGLKGSPTRVVKISKPKVTRECELCFAVDDQMAEDSIDKFFDHLKRKELV
jgi:electron transfer flavoprotein beta subunit